MEMTRRLFLGEMGTGLGLLGLAGVLADAGLLTRGEGATPLAPRQTHFRRGPGT